VDILYTVRFREVSGLSSFKNFLNQTTGCGDIAYSPVGYFILSHPVYKSYILSKKQSGFLAHPVYATDKIFVASSTNTNNLEL